MVNSHLVNCSEKVLGTAFMPNFMHVLSSLTILLNKDLVIERTNFV